MKPWVPAFAGTTIGRIRRASFKPDFAATFPDRHPREGGDPETSASCLDEALDSRVRGNDDMKDSPRFVQSRISLQPSQAVIPAKAGIQRLQRPASMKPRSRPRTSPSERRRCLAKVQQTQFLRAPRFAPKPPACTPVSHRRSQFRQFRNACGAIGTRRVRPVTAIAAGACHNPDGRAYAHYRRGAIRSATQARQRRCRRRPAPPRARTIARVERFSMPLPQQGQPRVRPRQAPIPTDLAAAPAPSSARAGPPAHLPGTHR
ncbi:hypothetical protein ABIE09_000223 [Lysobacter enzymogenes]